MTFFRGEKGTANSNAVRVLLTGGILALFILQGTDPLYRFWDNYLRSQPWISANLKIVPQQGATANVARVLYKVTAPYYVTGSWSGWVEILEGERSCNGGDKATYGPNSKERVWTWDAWFKGQCPQPKDTVFRLCIAYDVQTARGVPGQFGPYCSTYFDPIAQKEVE